MDKELWASTVILIYIVALAWGCYLVYDGYLQQEQLRLKRLEEYLLKQYY